MKFQGVVGLSDGEVELSRRTNGWNGLPKPPSETFLEKLLENFKDPLIKILVVALGVTMLLALMGYAKWIEGVGIAVAVFLATFVSTLSEYKNESSFQELQEKASLVHNNVFRNGAHVQSVLVHDIVVGDKVLLQAGDRVPADGHIQMGSLSVNQSSLTGESDSVPKRCAPQGYTTPANPTHEDFGGPLCVLRGTLVDDGEAVLCVDRVGAATYFGRVQDELNERVDRESPLQLKLSALAEAISRIGYLGAAGVALSFLFKQFVMDNNWDPATIVAYLAHWQVALHDAVTSVILAIIIIVVAVPEGLPMMIAIVLSLNMRKLLGQKVLVRKLLGIETAGSLNILFVDKTGTLTTGVFDCRMLVSGDATHDEATGTITGVHPDFRSMPPSLQDLYYTSVTCSSASVRDAAGTTIGGNSSERALLTFIPETSSRHLEFSIESEVLFNSERKFAATQVRLPVLFAGSLYGLFEGRSSSDDVRVTVVKGAPELVIANCNQCYSANGQLVPLDAPRLLSILDHYCNQGLRFIAVAYHYGEIAYTEGEAPTMPQGMNLVGVLGLSDSIRPESASSIRTARAAGIRVVMITGDRRETAEGVSHSIGLLSSPDDLSGVLTSDGLQRMSDADVCEMLPRLDVVCRARPTDKSRLVRIAQSMNMVVGMTGDGINDSAALRKADVGFSMGSGSEVAKEASDIVIMDDNFESITKAVLYGRTIYNSIQKFIVFQSTVNLASGVVVFVGPFMGFDFPLTLIQLLWVNLVMDTLAALAFGGEPALMGYMDMKPIRRDQDIINRYMWSSILSNGLFIAANCITFLKWDYIEEDVFGRGFVPGSPPHTNKVFLTAFFAFFIFMSTINAFNVRTQQINLFDHLLENQGFLIVIFLIFAIQISFSIFGGEILRTVGLTVGEWALVIVMASIVIPFDIARKLLYRRWRARARAVSSQPESDGFEMASLLQLQQVKTQ